MTKPKPKLTEFFLGGIALAFFVGSVLVFRHAALDKWHITGAALVITALVYFILSGPPRRFLSSKPTWVPEAEAGTVPRYMSRRWARANYFSGIISMEELNAFYVEHPEDLTDPDR